MLKLAQDERPKLIEITDFNGDGCWDWVIGASPPWAGLEVIVENCGTFEGAGFFWPANGVVEAVVTDLNNDGRPDIAFVTDVHDAEGNLVTLLRWKLNNIPKGHEGAMP